MAAPGFGFSFGDFVAAASLINEIRKALRDVGGAKDEFQQISIELQHLEILLDQLNRGSWDHGGDPGHLNAVKGMALACKVPLEDFLIKFRRYKIFTNRQSLSCKGRISMEARKMEWAANMKEDIAKFRAIIVSKIVAINLLLQLSMTSALSRIEYRVQELRDSRSHLVNPTPRISSAESSTDAPETLNRSVNRLLLICSGTKVGVEDFRRVWNKQHVEVKTALSALGRVERKQEQGYEKMVLIDARAERLEALLKQLIQVLGEFSAITLQLLQRLLRTDLEIYALLRQLRSSLPLRPTCSVQDSIHFTDALGRSQCLPYQWFRHWGIFESMLKCQFKNLPGERRVLNRQFHILNTRNPNFFIDETKWERSIFPGSQITMSMVMYGLLFHAGKCPRPGCGAENQIPADESGVVSCSSCQLRYHCGLRSVAPRRTLLDPFHQSHAFDIDGDDDNKSLFSTDSDRSDSTLESLSENSPFLVLNRDSTNEGSDSAHEDTIEELEAFKTIHIQTTAPGIVNSLRNRRVLLGSIITLAWGAILVHLPPYLSLPSAGGIISIHRKLVD
ncbi:hypothetical protein BGZ60DRAFT_517255 [Tricladium varicosporioides]|nr:hypothetical protein BGZ60DRAFT_517255 [Hymenoscyphus varicosporioides]